MFPEHDDGLYSHVQHVGALFVPVFSSKSLPFVLWTMMFSHVLTTCCHLNGRMYVTMDYVRDGWDLDERRVEAVCTIVPFIEFRLRAVPRSSVRLITLPGALLILDFLSLFVRKKANCLNKGVSPGLDYKFN